MPFLGVIHKAMHDTTKAVLDGLVEDVVDSNTKTLNCDFGFFKEVA